MQPFDTWYGYEPANHGGDLKKPKNFKGCWGMPPRFTPEQPGPRGWVHWSTEEEWRIAEIHYRREEKAMENPFYWVGSKSWGECDEKEKMSRGTNSC